MPSRFLNNININDSYTLPVADGAADQIITTDGAGQLSFMDQGDVIAGEADKAKSVILRVKNSTLSAMTKGQVICENVSISPPSGNLIEVGLADNNAAGRMPALGILNEDLDAAGGNKDEGDAIMFGKVSGIDTSAFSVGDEVFVSDVPGGLTTTKPTGVKYIQKVGVVIRDDNNNGTIEVFGAGRVNDVPTPLYVDHANQRLGIGEENPDTLLHLSGNSPTIKLEDDVASDYYNPKIEFYGSTFGGSVGFLSNPAIETLQLQYTSIALAKTTYLRLKNGEADFSSNVTNGTTLKTDGVLQVAGSNDSYFSNGNVGIGTTNPTTKLEVQDGSIKLNSTSGYPSTNSIIATWNGSSSPPMGNLSWHQNPGFIGSEWSHYKQSSPYTQARIRLIGDASSGGMFVNLNGSDVFTIQTSTSNVGIGTTNPTERLVVVGSANITSNLYIGNGNTLKSCPYPAVNSLVVGASNVLGGIANGIIGIGNTIDCTMEPWLNLGGNFIAGLNNDILGYYSHANAIFGQLNELGTSSINNSNTLISGSEHEATVSNALMFGTKCRALSGGTYSLTGGYDSNNFAGFGSVAIGAGATASNGNNQYAFGSGVTTPTFASYAYGADQFVVGKYNEYTNSSSVPHRFAVGNGSADYSRNTPFCVIGGGTYTNGQVSINDSDGYAYTSIPYSVFHVNGRSTSSYSSTFTVVSDERVKKNIVSYDKGLSEILQVQPKSYVFNGKANTIEGLESIGVLAQEIKEVFPETVGTANKRLNPEDEHETELYAVDISPVTYALINAVKELNAKIETLESRIQTLEGN